MTKDSRGFTLVELIVVVAIIGALTGILSLSISTVFSIRASRCASEINAYISMCRVNSMSRAGNIRMILDVDENGCIRGRYYEDSDLKDTAIFSNAKVTAEFTVGGVTTPLSDTDTLTLSFDRSTGGFIPQSVVGGVKTYCTAISVSSGRTYVITLVPSTGNHYIS